MELDTGASVSVISERDYYNKFKDIKIKKDGLKLQYYTNETVETMGYIRVNVKYKNNSFKGNWYIMKGTGPMLIGREWISQMDILSECKPEAIKNQNTLNTLHFKQLNMEQHIFKKFPEVFSDKLGLYNEDIIEILLQEGAKPKFIQHRAVPLALKNKIENELDRLEKEGVISKVKYSDWGTPIVPVIKPNGEIRIYVAIIK